MFLSQLAVVFVGIAGNRGKVVEHQLQPVFDHAHVEAMTMPVATLLTLTHHSDTSRDVVKKLHVDGLIGGELVEAGGKLTFRLVIYDGNGSLKSLDETPLAGKSLSKDDLEVIGSNLDDELEGLAKIHHEAPAAPEPMVVKAPPPPPPRVVQSAPVIADIAPTPKTSASSTPHGKLAEISFDDEAEKPPAGEAEHHDAAPVETADAVSMDDVESLTSGGSEATSPTSPVSTLHLHAGVGLGLASRSFAPGPSTVAGYSSSPVGAVHFEGGVEPTANTSLNIVAESTLAMNTPLAAGMASTSMSRWEVATGYTAMHGAIDLTPTLGLGRRTFSIDSTDPSRSPDGDYTYLIIGANASKSISKKITVRGVLAFEPVLGGVEPTEMAFGSATRWAIDAGAAVELRPISHVFARVALDYQRFAWSWDAAGARGAGGAVDSYPSGTLAVGAEY